MKFFVTLQSENKIIIINYPFHDVGNNRSNNMNAGDFEDLLFSTICKTAEISCLLRDGQPFDIEKIRCFLSNVRYDLECIDKIVNK